MKMTSSKSCDLIALDRSSFQELEVCLCISLLSVIRRSWPWVNLCCEDRSSKEKVCVSETGWVMRWLLVKLRMWCGVGLKRGMMIIA